jgi:serine/threonine protein kinase
VKPGNIVAFGNEFRLIDFGTTLKKNDWLKLEFTAHYTPPEQAKRVLLRKEQKVTQRAQQSGEASSATSPQLLSASPTVPDLSADGSYDVWSLGCVLFELRVGRPLFDESNADEILDLIAKATNETIRDKLKLVRQKQQKAADQMRDRGQAVTEPLQENEISLLQHMLAVQPTDRYTLRKVNKSLNEMVGGLLATQKEASPQAQLERFRQTLQSGQDKIGKQVDQVGAAVQDVGQHVKQVKAAVKLVSAGVNLVLEHQTSMAADLSQVLSCVEQLEVYAKQTLQAVFDVPNSDLPRLFTLLPDALDEKKTPLSAKLASSWKQKFLDTCSDICRGVVKAKRRASPFLYYRLLFLCEARDCAGECSSHCGYSVSVSDSRQTCCVLMICVNCPVIGLVLITLA